MTPYPWNKLNSESPWITFVGCATVVLVYVGVLLAPIGM